MISPVISILLILITLGIVIGATKLLERKLKFNPEFSRKAVHVLMGCITLSFPWLFNEKWQVIVLGFLALGALGAIRFMGNLKKGIGTVFYGVQRESLGEIYFPLSVVTLFCLTNGDKILYSIPILMLTFADSTAALIGSSYGRKNLACSKEDAKSLEGSFAFFLVAFMSTLVPVLLYTDTGRTETLFLALIMGLLAALIEIISYGGNDNLLIPLMGYAFLISHIHLSADELRGKFVIIAILAIFSFFWNRYGVISRLGIVGSLLSAYICIMLGGPVWFLAPFAIFVTYAILPGLKEAEKKQVVDYHIVISNITVGLVWVWLSAVLQNKGLFFYGFTAAFACHLGMNTYNRFINFFKMRVRFAVMLSFAKAFVCIVAHLLPPHTKCIQNDQSR